MLPIGSDATMRTNTKRVLWVFAILLLLAACGVGSVRFAAAKLQAEIENPFQ